MIKIENFSKVIILFLLQIYSLAGEANCSNVPTLWYLYTHWWWKPTWEFRTRRTQLLSKISSLSCGTLVIEVMGEYFIFNGWRSLLTPHSTRVLLSFRFIWIHQRRYYVHVFGILAAKKTGQKKVIRNVRRW